jgi:tetratricopeptide (TPR) repeat protein
MQFGLCISRRFNGRTVRIADEDAEQEKILQAQPDGSRALCGLGLIDAYLGRKEEALREGRRAVELLPLEKDALLGVCGVEYLALIAAWVGDKDFAFEQLESIIRLPSSLSYGNLKLTPFWGSASWRSPLRKTCRRSEAACHGEISSAERTRLPRLAVALAKAARAGDRAFAIANFFRRTTRHLLRAKHVAARTPQPACVGACAPQSATSAVQKNPPTSRVRFHRISCSTSVNGQK